MKHLFSALAAGALAFGATMPGIAGALEFPAKPVRIIVPYPPGGTTDMVARLIGEQLATQWKQSVVVDNRPGAGGIVGTGTAAKSTADGYTLLMGSVGEFGINPALYKKLPYDADADFAPVAMVARVPNVVVLSPAFAERARVQTLPEFIAYLKANPKRVNMASAGNGTSTHLAGELFQRMTGTEMSHVAYKGSSPAISDLMGGSVDVMFDNLPASLPFIRSGKLKPLAVTGKGRLTAAPDIPAVGELGFPKAESSAWSAVFLPAKTPPEIAKRLGDAIAQAIVDPEMLEVTEKFGSVPLKELRDAKLGEFVKTEIVRWRDVVQASGAKLE